MLKTSQAIHGKMRPFILPAGGIVIDQMPFHIRLNNIVTQRMLHDPVAVLQRMDNPLLRVIDLELFIWLRHISPCTQFPLELAELLAYVQFKIDDLPSPALSPSGLYMCLIQVWKLVYIFQFHLLS